MRPEKIAPMSSSRTLSNFPKKGVPMPVSGKSCPRIHLEAGFYYELLIFLNI